MRIEFDAAKDVWNCQQHGVSLTYAAELDWDFAMVWIDDRFDYDELRMRGLVPANAVLYCIAFVDRGDVRRVISLRRATRKEVRMYAETF